MKNRASKLILALLCVLFLGANVQMNIFSAYADDQKTITFHYTRDDKAYQNYKINIWTEYVQGQDFDFSVKGNEAVVSFKCAKNTEAVSFIIKESAGAKKDITQNRLINIEDINSDNIDVYVKANVKDYTLNEANTETSSVSNASSESTSQQEVSTSQQETTINQQETSISQQESSISQQETNTVQQETTTFKVNTSNKLDTKVIIVCDVVFVGILITVMLLILNNKKEM